LEYQRIWKEVRSRSKDRRGSGIALKLD